MENLDCSNILRHQICSKHILIAKVIKVLKLQKKLEHFAKVGI
jgi:hypothetical protein